MPQANSASSQNDIESLLMENDTALMDCIIYFPGDARGGFTSAKDVNGYKRKSTPLSTMCLQGPPGILLKYGDFQHLFPAQVMSHSLSEKKPHISKLHHEL